MECNSSLEESENNINENKIRFISKPIMQLFYDIFNIKQFHNTSFEMFYDLLTKCVDEVEVSDISKKIKYKKLIIFLDNQGSIPLEVIELFSTQYIRGFSKMILDIGYDEYLYQLAFTLFNSIN